MPRVIKFGLGAVGKGMGMVRGKERKNVTFKTSSFRNLEQRLTRSEISKNILKMKFMLGGTG